MLAAGGIENARLLLLSNSRQPAGLGNQNDLVGRYFMEHPHFLGGHIVSPQGEPVVPPALYQLGPPDSGRPLGALALSWEVQAQEGIGNLCAFIHTTSQASISPSVRSLRALRQIARHGFWDRNTLGHLKNTVSGPTTLFRFVKDRLTKASTGRLGELMIMSEQTPNPESRVTLSDKRDALGLRQASLTWKLSEQDFRTIRVGEQVIDAALQKSGTGRLRAQFFDESPPPPIGGGWHHMGTTRMSHAESLGVVDADAKVHGLNNLYLAGSSVFPAVGYANPTLTLVALAVKLADYLNQLEKPRRVEAEVAGSGPQSSQAGGSMSDFTSSG